MADHRQRRPRAALLALVGAGLLAGLAVPITAFAHARPVRVVPGHGAVLSASPAEVEIETSEDMERTAGANEIVVTDASGKTVTTGTATVDAGNRRRLTAPLAASLPAGDYTIRWKTLSAADGEADQGTFTFRVDPGATPIPGRSDLALPTAVPGTAESDGDGGPSVVLIAAIALGAVAVVAFAWFIFRPSRSS